MSNFADKISNRKFILALVFLAFLNLFAFKFLYGFHENNDTEGFLYMINFFKGNVGYFSYPNRYLNPFYAVIGSTLFFFLSATNSLIVTNIFFYFGLVFLTFGLIRRVFKSNEIGIITALTVMSGYPMLRYALTQVQDIGGYFWFLLTLYSSWRWWESKEKSWLYLGGVAVAFGVLTKESGCMGALFTGILLLLNKDSWKEKIVNLSLFSSFPLLTIIINAIRGHDVDYSSARWFIDAAWRQYAAEYYTFIKWLGVNITTYNLLWIFVFIGAYLLVKNWHKLDQNIKIYLLAVTPSSLSYFAWPLFIGRTVYISSWLFMPIAAYGIYQIYLKGEKYRAVAILAVFLCVVTPFILQSTLKYANLFGILRQCHNQPLCSWNTFWANRNTYSDIGI